jgi:hypothetical protein
MRPRVENGIRLPALSNTLTSTPISARTTRSGLTVLTVAAGALLLPAPAVAQSAQPVWETGKWQFTATLYGWVARITSFQSRMSTS